MGQNSVLLQDRLAGMAQTLSGGGNPILAQPKALAMLVATVRREAFVMAYSDCFFIMGVVLLASLAIVPLLARPKRGAAVRRAH